MFRHDNFRRTQFFCAKLFVTTLLLTHTTVANARQQEVDPATAIAGATLAKDLLSGINNALTVQARADAATESAGPDDDDLGSRATNDYANTFLETDLHAWTTLDTGGADLGPNPAKPHKGLARMHVTSGLLDANWTVVPGHRYALAIAEPDSTPVANSTNKTAVASVATFGHNSKIKKGFTVQATDGVGAEIALQNGEDDIVASSAGAILWSTSAFGLSETNGIVTVTPPVDRVNLIHNFVQLEGSVNYRNPFIRGFLPNTLGNETLNSVLDDIETGLDADLNTVPMGNNSTADFTLTAIDVLLAPADIARGGRTDHEVIEEYLRSHAISVTFPDSVQPGFAIPNWSIEFVGGNFDFAPGTLLGDDGGFGSPEAIDGQSSIDFSELAGLVVNTEGSLLDAINLAANTPGSYVHDLVKNLAVGDDFELDLNVNQSSHTMGTSEAINVIEIPEAVIATRGSFVSGDVASLSESDNVDYSLQRNIADFQARTEFVVRRSSPTPNPSTFEVSLEGSVFARSPVIQTIELYNYVEGEWEFIDESLATNAIDSTVKATAFGDLSRFVNESNLSVEARIGFQSESPRQRFATNTDQFYWTIR